MCGFSNIEFEFSFLSAKSSILIMSIPFNLNESDSHSINGISVFIYLSTDV